MATPWLVADSLLVFNAGSSSLKFAAWPHSAAGVAGDPLLRGEIAGVGSGQRIPDSSVNVSLQGTAARAGAHGPTIRSGADFAACCESVLGWIDEERPIGAVAAVGHRVVHGGPRHAAPARLDSALLAELAQLTPLAPLHQPQGMAVIGAVSRWLPAVPQVVAFDTAFHRSQTDVAQSYALPESVRELGLRRYGFHGLSCQHVLARLARLAGAATAGGRVIIAHLGGGASLTAVCAGRSVATTMGMTALDGLPMGTRSGSIDPGALLFLMRKGFDADRLEHLLYRQSGLLGLSGTTSDVRSLLDREAGDPHARFALEYFVYRAQREMGSMVAALGGLDTLVFTGGIGQNSAEIRARIVRGLEWLGLALDAAANDATHEATAREISAPGGRIGCWVVPADEERVIAEAVASTLFKP